MNIKNKIVFLVLVCVLAIAGFGGTIIYLQQEKSIRKEAERFGINSARQVSEALVSLMNGNAWQDRKIILDAVSGKSEVLAVHSFRSPIMETEFGPTPPKSRMQGEFERRVFGAGKPVTRVVKDVAVPYVEVVVPMKAESGKCVKCHKVKTGTLLGGLSMRVSMAAFGADIRKDRMIILQVTAGFIALLVFLIVSMLTRLVDRPIKTLVAAAEKIANGEITDVKLDFKSKDEMGRLAAAFEKMTHSLTEIASSARRMAEGDLSKRIDNPGELVNSFNNMVNSLSHLVQGIRFNAKSLGESVRNITRVAGEQSQGAEEQIKKLDNLELVLSDLAVSASNAAAHSAGMLEIAKLSLGNAKMGHMASREGQRAMILISRGMSETNRKAAELKEKTAQIGKVLDIINDIAMETKILSVNASIEASKAGEQGKGFAVVAEEVAKLAENVVRATATIQDINEEIQTFSSVLIGKIREAGMAVQAGAGTMKKVGKSLVEILGASAKTAAAARQITVIAKDQHEKSRSILSAMQMVSAKSRELSGSAEKSSDEAERIRRDFENLQAEVSRFRLAGDEPIPAENSSDEG